MKHLTIAAAALLLAAPVLAQSQHEGHAGHDHSKPAAETKDKSCEEMAKKMGLSQQHNHAEEKGVVAKSPMNKEHDRCKTEAAKSK